VQGKGQRAEGRGQRERAKVNRDLRTATSRSVRDRRTARRRFGKQEEEEEEEKKKKRDLVDLGLGLIGHWGREWQEEDGLFDASKDRRHLRHWRSETPARQRGTKLPPRKITAGQTLYTYNIQHTVSLCVCAQCTCRWTDVILR
jgi:hypothetical protein